MVKRRFKNIDGEVSLLGFGAMRMPLNSDDTKDIDIQAVTEMIDTAIDGGVNYFDTAYPYHAGESESTLRKVLVERYDRDKFYIATKLPVWKCNSYEDYENTFAEQLENLGVDYFDYYLLHSLSRTSIEKHTKIGMIKFIENMKCQGKAKHVGFSYHDDYYTFEKFLNQYHDSFDFVQLQLNYLDWDTLETHKCYDLCIKYGLPVVVMEPVKGGVLADISPKANSLLKTSKPDKSIASWAISYAASMPNVLTVLSGMSNMEQMKDNIDTLTNFEPLTDDDYNLLKTVVKEIQSMELIPCTGCEYCIDCPVGINIPNIFTLYNSIQHGKSVFEVAKLYNEIDPNNRADKCIECGNCTSICPQNIPIPEHLKKIAKKFA